MSAEPSHSYVITVLIGLDILLNAILGGRSYETISGRIGQSIVDGGWGSYMPWPGFLRRHFVGSIVHVTYA